MWNKYGEQATGNEIFCGNVYCGYYGGTTSKHFITCDAPSGCCGKAVCYEKNCRNR